jgi:PKD repeat protein
MRVSPQQTLAPATSRRWRRFHLAALLVTISTCVLAGPVLAAGWPTLGGNAQHTGQSLGRGPTQPSIQWQRVTANATGGATAPVVAGDGSIYFAATTATGLLVQALTRDGALLWQLLLPDAHTNARTTPLLTTDTLYVSTLAANGGALCALNRATGAIRWQHPYDPGTPGTPVEAPDGNIILSVGSDTDATVLALSSENAVRWVYRDPAAKAFSDSAITPSGDIYILSSDGPVASRLHALTPAGTRRWTADLDGAVDFYQRSPTIGDDGVYAPATHNDGSGSYSGRVAAFTFSGTRRWNATLQDLAGSLTLTTGSVIAPNPYGATAISRADGRHLWSQGLGSNQAGERVSTSIDGTTYQYQLFTLVAIDPSGARQWQVPLPWDATTSDVTLTPDGGILLVGSDGQLARIGDPATCLLACADPTVPATGIAGNSVTFTGTALPTNCHQPPSYAWSFGDGTASSSASAANHTYASAGTYTWTFLATADLTSCQKTGTITISPADSTGCTSAPAANTIAVTFQGATSGCTAITRTPCLAGEAIGFDVASVGNSFAACTHTFAWDFGDQATTSAKSPTHFFLPGTYSVRVTVSNPFGSATVGATVVVVGSTPPTASLDVDVATLVAGRGATLRWTTANATSVRIDPGIGTVPSTGSRLVTPTSTTTFTLTATGISGTTQAKRTLTVVPTAAAAFPPVLFVHGFCSDASTWNSMITTLQHTNPTRYNGLVGREDLYYDGTYVRDRNDEARSYPANQNTVSVLGSLQHSMVYTITFYDATNLTFSDTSVAQLDIRDLAGQLAKVIEAIRSVNSVPQVDLVAHSLGGLVSRAYLEGLATTSGSPVTYHDDVHALVTIDTPHNGAQSILTDPTSVFCFLAHNIQRDEMTPTGLFLTLLNTTPLPQDVSVTSIASRTFALATDGVVSSASQDLTSIPAYQCAANVDAIPNTVDGSTYSGLLHTAVHGLPETAAWVDTRLGLVAVVRENCMTIGSGNTGRLSIPGYFTAGLVNVVLRFLTGSAAKGLARPLAACSMDVVARAESGAALAYQTIPAEGFQTVSLGALPADGWHLEVVPHCDVTVEALVGVRPPSGAKRHAVTH